MGGFAGRQDDERVLVNEPRTPCQNDASGSATSWLFSLSVGDGAGLAITQLLEAKTFVEVLSAWVAARVGSREVLSRQALIDLLADDVVQLDELVSEQLDAVLHHEAFQRLEAAWRSLAWLTERAGEAVDENAEASPVKVKVLSASKRELARDFAKADFDQSAMWEKVYEEEFGTPGGKPYGLLLGDYTFGKSNEDLGLLASIAEVAAASFSPFVAAADPNLVGLESWQDLEEAAGLENLHRGSSYAKWKSLRKRDEARFVGLALPRVLARLPYEGCYAAPNVLAQREQTWSTRGFRYQERVEGPDGGFRLWTNAGWAFAGVVISEFGRSGWFSDIRGASRGLPGGGLVQDLPVDSFGPSEPLAFRGPTETTLTEATQQRLATAGFLPLTTANGSAHAVFYSNQSVHAPQGYDTAEATANARISSMLQYMLCVSRFAHYLKVIGRDRIGSVTSADECKSMLEEWIRNYVTPDEQASPEARAEQPLRAAQVEVREAPSRPGSFLVSMRLQPHFQLDELEAGIRLTTMMKKQ